MLYTRAFSCLPRPVPLICCLETLGAEDLVGAAGSFFATSFRKRGMKLEQDVTKSQLRWSVQIASRMTTECGCNATRAGETGTLTHLLLRGLCLVDGALAGSRACGFSLPTTCQDCCKV